MKRWIPSGKHQRTQTRKIDTTNGHRDEQWKYTTKKGNERPKAENLQKHRE